MREAWDIPAVSEYAEFNKKEWPAFLLSRGRVADARTAADQLIHGKWPAGRAAGHLMMGHVLLAEKKTGDARQELAAAKKDLASTVPDGRSVRSTAQPFVDGLEGEILLRSGDPQGSVMLKELQAKLRAIPGPDAWSQVLFKLESIARVAREAGDWKLAEFSAGEMFGHDPQYAGSHYAMALTHEHTGDNAAARREFAKAAELWNHADSGMEELVRSRKSTTSGR